MGDHVAVLVVGSDHTGIESIDQEPALARSAIRIADWASNQLSLALAPRRVRSIFNEHDSPEPLLEQVARYVRQCEKADVESVLVFVVAHGFLADDRSLRIALPNTHDPRDHSQSLAAADLVRRVIRSSEAAGHYTFVFDACYSGAIVADMHRITQGIGAFKGTLNLVTSSFASKKSYFDEDGTRFTKAWIHACTHLGERDDHVGLAQIIQATGELLKPSGQQPTHVAYCHDGAASETALPLRNDQYPVVRSIGARLVSLERLLERLGESVESDPSSKNPQNLDRLDALLQTMEERLQRIETQVQGGSAASSDGGMALGMNSLFMSVLYNESSVGDALRRLAFEVSQSETVKHYAVSGTLESGEYESDLTALYKAFESVLERTNGSYYFLASNRASRERRVEQLREKVKSLPGRFYYRYAPVQYGEYALTVVVMHQPKDRKLVYVASGSQEQLNQRCGFSSDPTVFGVFDFQFDAEFRALQRTPPGEA